MPLCSLCSVTFVDTLLFPLSEHVISLFGTPYTQGKKGYALSSLSLWLALYKVLSTGVRELLSELSVLKILLCALPIFYTPLVSGIVQF